MELATQQAVLTLRECRLFAHLYACVPQFFFAALLLVAGLLPTVPACAQAQETEPAMDTLVTATLAADTIDNTDPEWYVAPVIPAPLRAPKHAPAAAASCTRVEAIQTFNIDSVLTEGTYYEYDAKGNVISTTVWTYNPDGTMTGKSKNEYAFDATGTQTMTAVYIWDGAANDWKGTEKYEYVYKTFAGEKKMTSSTSSVWLNGAWVVDLRYTYDYDASAREISYFEYRRNTSTNELQPVKGREQSWTDDLQTLEALYTAYANGKWTAGTKKEWAFDGNGTQTMYATYTISNGAWVNATKETWAFTSGKQTLHEQFIGEGNNWSKTLREENEYDGANLIRVENYTYADGVATGTKKETTAYASGKKTEFVTYAWSNGAWVNATKETWAFTSGKQTLHEKSAWVNDDWSKTLREETEYSGSNIIRIENYSYSNGVATGTKKEEYTYTGGKKTEFVTYTWSNGTWANATKETWDFTNGKQTLHEQYVGEDANWSKTLREENEYDGANLIRVENYSYENGVTTGTKKETYGYSGSDKETIVYAWENDAWIESTKEVLGYTSGMQTLHEQYVWNNAWVGVTKETWTYTSSKLTRHETYAWGSSDWSILTQENTTYSGANIIRIENYEWVNGVKTGTQKEEYTYTSGEKTMTVVYAWANNDWVYSTKNEAGYRDGNTQVSEANYTWNGSAWVGIGNKKETTYDADKLSTEKTYAWDIVSGDWLQVLDRICIYDSKGRLVGDTTWRYIDEEWVNYKLQTHGYDSHDNDTLAITATWNGTDWEPSSISKGTYLYTPNGNPLLVETYTGTEAKWTGDKKIEYTYDSQERLLKSLQYQWKNNRWVNKSLTEKKYDQAGHEILSQGSNWSNNKWVGTYKYENAYDEAGNATMQAQYTGSGGSWFGLFKSERGYDSHGRVLYSISFTWRNNTWAYRSKSVYEYDDYGNVIDRKIYSYSGGAWVGDQWNAYAYDSQNREVSNKEYFWISDQWMLSTLSAKTYDESDSKLLREISGSWNSSTGFVISYSDKHYFYNCAPHFYTVRFVNYDGQVLANTTAQEGETPVYPSSTPTKPADTENTYTFSGWTPALAPVTANITYTATFTAIPKAYTITWKNEDGSIIKQEQLEYGTTPAHADITKESTAEYTYTFAGWTPGIGIVTSDAEYTATFTQTKNSYLITFRNEDGTVLSSETYEYGAMPTIPTTPTKPADGANTYTFSGWDKEVVPVKEAATYTATYNATKNSYTITFADEDGMVLQSSEVEYGAMPTAPSDPTKVNTAEWSYTFAGWTPQVEAVTGDAEYIATYDSVRNSYTITWKNEDGSVIESETLEYGVTPAHANIYKENTAEWTYTFAGWSPGIVPVTGDATYTATFTATKNKYLITFKDEDGSVLKSEELEYGVMPTAPSDPTKASTAEDTYTFNGWNKEVVPVKEATTYTATYNATKNSYTITFADEDGMVLQSSEVEYGAMPTAPSNPTKANTAEWSYTFAGWTPQVEAVTGNAEYTATFTATKNKYLVTFKDEDGTTLKSEELEYGVTPVAPEDPTKASTVEYTYAFNGWDKEIASVTEAATYTATYTATKKTYTITWKNDDGSVIESETLEYGVTPAHADITKESTAEYTYTFAGWTPQVETVTGNAEYTATFTATKRTYTVNWLNEDGSVIESQTLEYGATPTHADITKESTAEYTYTFAGWTPAVATVTGDATYTATFTATERVENKTFTITFYYEDGVTVLDQVTVKYGETPSTSLIPSKYSEEHYYYTFFGWSPEVVPAESNASYTATFKAVPKQYTVTFKNHNGRTLLTTETPYGEIPEYTGETPTRTKDKQYTYTFSGWSPELTEVTGPTTYTAVFEGTLNQYTVIFLDEDGTELDRQTLDYGAMPVYAGETPQKEEDEQYRYTFKCWSPKLSAVSKHTTYRATYSRYDKTQGIEDVQPPYMEAQKVLIDGTIYILRGGKTYTLQGLEVR